MTNRYVRIGYTRWSDDITSSGVWNIASDARGQLTTLLNDPDVAEVWVRRLEPKGSAKLEPAVTIKDIWALTGPGPDEPVNCPEGHPTGRQTPLSDDGVVTGWFRCEVCDAEYLP